jgi:hypothetical protein
MSLAPSRARLAGVLLCGLGAACARQAARSADSGAGASTLAAPPGGPAAAAAITPARDTQPATAAPASAPAPIAVSKDLHAAPAGSPSGVTAPALADSAEGRVAIVGSLPFTRVELRPAGAGASVRLTGDATATLRRMSGVVVRAHGTRTPAGELRVARFVVRSVDGRPALDGVLAAEGERLYLVTAGDRRVLLANPPSALRDHVGARVWLTGEPTGTIVAYGIISPSS